MSIADELLSALPQLLVKHPEGPTTGAIATFLRVSYDKAREAANTLDREGRATFLRYQGSNSHHLLPVSLIPRGSRVCAWCKVVFYSKNYKAKCCSKSCGLSRYWASRTPEQRLEALQPAIKASLASPLSYERRYRPENIAALRAGSEAVWADPARRAVMIAKVQAHNGTPEARRAMSARRKKDWEDPAYREKMVSGHHAVINDEYRANRSRANKEAWAKNYEARLPKARENVAKAVAAIRGSKQSPEHLAKRVASWRKTTGNGERTKIITRSMQERWADPVWRETVGMPTVIANGLKRRGRKDTPETAERKREAQRKRYYDPNGNHPLVNATWTPEKLAKRAATMAAKREARLAALPPEERKRQERLLRNSRNAYARKKAAKEAAKT